MNQDIHELRRALRNALGIRADTALNQPSTAPLRRLEAVRRKFSPPRGHRSEERVARAVLAFRMQREKTPFTDIKYACYGIARATDWGGRRLIDDTPLLKRLLGMVSTYPQGSQRHRQCLAGLIAAWEKEIQPGIKNGKETGANPALLREYLMQNQATLRTSPSRLRAPLQC